jgi:hypothetical protein
MQSLEHRKVETIAVTHRMALDALKAFQFALEDADGDIPEDVHSPLFDEIAVTFTRWRRRQAPRGGSQFDDRCHEQTSGVSATRRPTDFGSVRRSQRGIAWANGQVGWAALERGKPQNSPKPVSPGTGNYRRNCTLRCTVIRGSTTALRIGRAIPYRRFFSGEPKGFDWPWFVSLLSTACRHW